MRYPEYDNIGYYDDIEYCIILHNIIGASVLSALNLNFLFSFPFPGAIIFLDYQD